MYIAVLATDCGKGLESLPMNWKYYACIVFRLVLNAALGLEPVSHIRKFRALNQEFRLQFRRAVLGIGCGIRSGTCVPSKKQLRQVLRSKIAGRQAYSANFVFDCDKKSRTFVPHRK